MKKLIVLGIGTVLAGVGIGILAGRQNSAALPHASTITAAAPEDPAPVRQPVTVNVQKQKSPPLEQQKNQAEAVVKSMQSQKEAVSPTLDEINSAINTLISPQASFSDKQAVWTRLRQTGELDRAITQLQQLAADNPRTADYQSVLGQAYLKKATDTDDVPEKGILAMTADRVLGTALQLDPGNWDARYTKTVAMSYWPPELNKGQEVVDQFDQLITQQETQSSQPQFVMSYLAMGDFYRRIGQTDKARQVWERGAKLFPNDVTLSGRLAPSSASN